MKKNTPIYLPVLHRELAPTALPETVLFLAPGWLPDGSGSPESFFLPANLPFGGSAARAVLREMLELGSTLSLGGKDAPSEELRLIESGARAAAAPRAGAVTAAEERELTNFSGSGELPFSTAKDGASSSVELARKELVRAQKILLLAWELEETLLGIKKAEASLARQDHLLFSTLHEPENEEGVPAEKGDAPAPIAWQVLLEAAAPFLPADALLITADLVIREALAALHPLADLSDELAETLAAGAEWRCAHARLGDLLGDKGKTVSRPWLDAVYKFVVLPGN